MLMTSVFFSFLFIVGLLTTILKLPTKKFTSMVLQSFLFPNTPSQKTNKAPPTAHEKTKAIKKSNGSSPSSTKNKAELELKGIFATFDMNKDGFITKQELSESLKNIGMSMSEKDVAEFVEKADFNKDGLIDFDEFCELVASQDREKMINSSQSGDRELVGGGGKEEEREGDLKEAFDVFDGDRDGLITVEELGLVLNSLGFKEGRRLENCKEMIRQVDKDGDGMVNFDEFKCMMRNGSTRLIPVS